MNLRILYQDEHLVAVDKPAGFHVHPPEDARHRIPDGVNCVKLLGRQLSLYVHPVHRLDRATSGVLLFGLSPESARRLGAIFQERRVRKSYYCVTRGWLREPLLLDHPLKAPGLGPDARIDAATDFQPLAWAELDIPSGSHPTSRYSLVRAVPVTGRMHQIRRHLVHLSHPIVGDTVYGDGVHNRIYREQLSIQGLLLKAYSLEFTHPFTDEPMHLRSRWDRRWHSVFDLFRFCPFDPPAVSMASARPPEPLSPHVE